MKAREATHDRGIFRESFVAVQFDEVLKQALDQIQRVRSIGVPRKLYSFERGSRFDRFFG